MQASTQPETWILVAGSRRGLDKETSESAFNETCHALGVAIARNGFGIIVGSFDEVTADNYVLRGAIDVPGSQKVLIRPKDMPVEQSSPFESVELDLQPGTWEDVRPVQVKRADAIVLVSGASGTSDVLSAAVKDGDKRDRQLPIVLIPALGGFAAKAYSKYRQLYIEHGVTENVLADLENLHGNTAEAAVEILRQLLATPQDVGSASDKTEDSVVPPPIGTPGANEVRPFHDDQPATEDQLGREMFAGILASRLRQIESSWGSDVPKPFLIHLNGPWGSGKSTILHFLKQQLEQGRPNNAKKWVVADFNAWQHQHEPYPWWDVVDTLFRQAVKKIGYRKSVIVRLKEHFWRVRHGWGTHVFALIIFSWILFLIFRTLDFSSGWKSISDSVETASLFVAIAVSIWGIASKASTTFTLGLAKAGEQLRHHDADPDRIVGVHFATLIRWVSLPTTIQVDDLDRCREDYVVTLLEGIQTRFRNCNVAYVVAADRDWLRRSFERVYESFEGAIGSPGRPLGLLFLEKLFQLSVDVPPLRKPVRDAYWRHLTSQNRQEGTFIGSVLSTEERKEIENLKPQDIPSRRQVWASDSPEDIARRYELARRMGKRDVDQATENFLQQFSNLVEPNPRSMKRLVNAFGVRQQIMTVFGDPKSQPDDGEIALWTILSQRWPTLAEVLLETPGLLAKIDTDSAPEAFDESLQTLVVGNDSVLNVIDGTGVEFSLTESTIRAIAGLRAD